MNFDFDLDNSKLIKSDSKPSQSIVYDVSFKDVVNTIQVQNPQV